MALIYAASGQLNFTALHVAGRWPEVAAGLRPYLGLLLLALLLKAGALPAVRLVAGQLPALPPAVLALVGGLLTKVAAYVLLRLLGQVFAVTRAPGWRRSAGWPCSPCWSGCWAPPITGTCAASWRCTSSARSATCCSASRWPARPRRPGPPTSPFHNILVKANLFLIAGLMFASAGHYDLRRIGGLYATRPLLAVLFLVSAFSLVGVPPSTGFWGKFMLLREAFEQERYVWGGGALAVGLLTLYSMSKIWLEGSGKRIRTRSRAPGSCLRRRMRRCCC